MSSKWKQMLHGPPWRRTTGVEPCAMKVARTVLNGGREETYSNATRLAPTQPRFQQLTPGVDMIDIANGYAERTYKSEQSLCQSSLFSDLHAGQIIGSRRRNTSDGQSIQVAHDFVRFFGRW